MDHDLYGASDWSAFTAPHIFDAALDGLWAQASLLAPETLDDPLGTIQASSNYGASLSVEFGAIATDASGLGAEVFFSSNTYISPITVNGVAQDEAQDGPPELDGALPLYMQPDDQETDTDAVATPDHVGTAGLAGDFFDVETGNTVVAGGNLAINQALITVQHIDAPVFVVMGDVFAVSAISQTNVIHDINSGASELTSNNTAINAATFATTAAGTDGASSIGYFPGLAPIVTQVDADFVTMNRVNQFNYISDHDGAQIMFSGEDSFLIFGDNVAFNTTNLIEYGQGYDLIIIGGAMYDISVIFQTNVIFDDDTVAYGSDWADTTSLSDNLAYNSASITSGSVDTYAAMDSVMSQAAAELNAGAITLSADALQHSAFAGQTPMQILYITGDFINISAIEQTNIIGGADQIRFEIDALADQDGAVVTTTTGSNAAVNIAQINEFGEDSTIMVGGEVYDDLLLFQAELIDSDAQPLASEAVAFLVDGMIEDAPSDTAIYADNHDASMSGVDVMGSVIA